MQYEGGTGYKGPIDCLKKVVRTVGVPNGLYRGWSAVCFCRMSNYAYFGSYAFIASKLRPKGNDGDAARGKLPIGSALLAGGLSGFCYWASCFPMDVIKNRIQSAPDVRPPVYPSLRGAFAAVYRTEGIRAFGAGFVPCVLRAFPANAAAFVGFEAALRVLPENIVADTTSPAV